MHDTAKYLIHANITADGVVERSDVVGAIFGQTEGLLGDDLDLRDLQDSSKVGRIDVEIDSRHGQSFGTVTIASGLDQVETAILGASLETIERVGPCRATLEVERIEDVRAAKRRDIVDRAKQLLGEAFDGSMLTSQELIEEVRRSIRVEDITEYEGYPAGPRVADSDAIIVVEGRADVLTLLRYGIKNAVAVEGTNVPDAVADLTKERTVTAFLDGDRGGDLILKELSQVGDVDYVAIAPAGHSVEDLDRSDVMRALREKVAFDALDGDGGTSVVAATDGSARPAPPEVTTADPEGEAVVDAPTEPTPPSVGDEPSPDVETAEPAEEADASAATTVGEAAGSSTESAEPETEAVEDGPEEDESVEDDAPDSGADEAAAVAPETLPEHVEGVVGGESGRARLLSADCEPLSEGEAEEAFDLVRDAEAVPDAVVLDGEVTQRLLDVCAQRGVGQVVGRSRGSFVKQPTSVRVRTAEEFRTRD
ncbi:DNA primase DnaG [Halomarina ordinaria]|uniref:DNA primase DnaG n=1 Tax=Halomarina ordinaria TaxID=3033939 RepID=A0ABD5U3V1_9EURY|nr:DNA primase DnaG [Halomarina sp. PSRA2]